MPMRRQLLMVRASLPRYLMRLGTEAWKQKEVR